MKKIALSFLALILGIALLCVGVSDKPDEVVQAEDSMDEQTISVSVYGESQIDATPDKIVIYANIQNINNDLTKARDDSFEVFNKVVDTLTKQNIEKNTIIIESFSTYPSYDYSCGKKLLGYNSNINFTFEMDELNNVQACLQSLDEAGTVTISSVNYKVSDENKLYEEALNQAFENAKTKAIKLLGKENLSVVNIEEESTYYCNTLYRNYTEGMNGTDMVGKVFIKARVKVEFC